MFEQELQMNHYSICRTDTLFADKKDLQFGTGFFETIKIINKKPVFLSHHLTRLMNSINSFNQMILPDFGEIEEFINIYLNKHDIDTGAIKLIAAEKQIHLIYRPLQTIKLPVSIMISNTVKRNSCNPVYMHKTLSYFENIILWNEAEKNNVYESLVLNEHNHICEGSRHNLFMIKKSILITPPVSSGCLPGITRQVILENMNVTESPIAEDDIFECDELFLTNSLQGVVPITSIYNRELYNLKTEQSQAIKHKLSQIEKNYLEENNRL